MSERYTLETSREDLEWLAGALASAMVGRAGPRAEAEQVYVGVVGTIDVLDHLDLDALATAVGGVVDPLGQLKQWLYDQLKAIASWISASVTSFVDQVVNTVIRPALDWISSRIEELFSWARDALSGVTERLADIAGQLKKVAVEPILEALRWVQEQLPALARVVEGAMTAVGEWVASLSSTIKEAMTTLSSAVGGLVDTVKSALQTIDEFITALPERISDLIGGLADQVSSLLDSVRSAVQGILDTISKIPEALQSMVSWLAEQLAGLADLIKSAAQTAVGAVSKVSEAVHGLLSWLGDQASALADALREATSALSSMVGEVASRLGSLLESASTAVTSLMDAVRESAGRVLDALGRVPGLVQDLLSRVAEQVAGLVDTIRSGAEEVGGLLAKLTGAASALFDRLRAGAESLAAVIDRAAESVSKMLSAAATQVESALSVVRGQVEVLAKVLAGARQELAKTLELISRLPDAAKRTVEVLVAAVENLPALAARAVENVELWVWEHLPEWAKRFLSEAPRALELVGRSLTGFVNAIMKFPEWFPRWFEEHIAKPIVNAITSTFTPLAAVGDFISKLLLEPRRIPETLHPALAAAGEAVMMVVPAVAGPAAEAIKRVLERAWGALLRAGYFLEALGHEYMRSAGEYLAKAGEALGEALEKVGVRGLAAVLARPWLGPVLGAAATAATMVLEALRGNVENPAQFVYELVNYAVVGAFVSITVDAIMRPLAESMRELELSGEVLGVGAKVRIALGRALSKLLDNINKVMPDVFRYMIIGHMIWWAEPTRVVTRYKLTEWITVELPPIEQTLAAMRRRMLTPLRGEYYEMFTKQLRMGGIYKGFVDSLYPLPPKLIEDLAKRYGECFELYSGELDATVVEDRFGTPRKFPASLIFALPTPSELARMMIRDIIQDPAHFAAVMAMHGFHPDAAFMFYLLHFRYPPPEKLWEFTCRGVAGMLWYRLTEAELSDARNIATKFGLDPREVEPVDPAELNFKARELFSALSKYMKWHDYITISWLRPKDIGSSKPFTSDNAIIKDVLADIPTKIDQRWMVKWGLYELMSSREVELKTPLRDAVASLLDDHAAGKIQMDLTLFARTLQATGLHPDWVPVVAVAEAANALSEERTLLRTGFINLYKEGLWGLGKLEQLLSGFFVASFKVAWFDIGKMEWVTEKWINLPIMFLPPERRLLELRAVMDRALDIYREAYRYLVRAALYYTVTVDEAGRLLSEIVAGINESFFAKAIEELTGKKLGLELDRGYWGAWRKYVELLQEVEARERTRFYARYLLWSVLWALRLGYVGSDEARDWVSKLVEKMHEHPVVREAIELSVEFMVQRFFSEIRVRAVINLLRSRRISLPEALEALKKAGFSEEQALDYINANVVWYTPGLTTYATLLEIVPEAVNVALRALEHFNLPGDELPYWRLYIARKPIQDELTLLRTRIYNALAVGMPAEELVSLLKSYALSFRFEGGELKIEAAGEARKLLELYSRHRDVFQAFGIAPQEWVLYNVIAELEGRVDELRQALRERVPSPSTLAVLAEYLVLPRELVERALDRYKVAREWRELWLKYIEVKPLKSDAKSLLSVYIRALRYGAVARDEVEGFIKELPRYGFTEAELELVRRRVELEEAIIEARELRRAYLPTPTMLATLAEYVRVPRELVEEALRARRVPREWVELWLRYVEVRPLADEARLLATAFFRARRYGVPLGDLARKVEDTLKSLGFTEEELELRELRATIEAMIDEWREARREYVPTPLTLASIAEVVPEARKLFTRVVEARRIPAEWVSVWAKYVHARPLQDEVRKYVTSVARLFEYFVITEDDLRKALEKLRDLGLEDAEIDFMVSRARLEAGLRAFRELVGTPRELTYMAEYSPTARRLALAQVQRMIDALPVDPATKEFLKRMWEEYVRVRPVYDEVRRYVTELLSDYAEGVITREELARELNELKTWGLDDHEVQFYLWLAERRRQRRLAREARRTPGF